MPQAGFRFEGVTFHYPGYDEKVLDGFDLDIPAGSSPAIVGQNGAGKTTLAKLLCRLYDPVVGRLSLDDVPLNNLSLSGWCRQVTAVFQDFIQFELTLRDNVASLGAPDEVITASLEEPGADHLASLDTTCHVPTSGVRMSQAVSGNASPLLERSARLRWAPGSICSINRPRNSMCVGKLRFSVVSLEATRDVTTILISHRFSTVRQADRICVLKEGHVLELGCHDELMSLGGRYQTMFNLQASRFEDEQTEAAAVFDE